MGRWAEYLAKSIAVAAPGGSYAIASTIYKTRRANIVSDKVPVRKDIRAFTEVELYLYFEGPKKFQAVEFDNPLSYFRLRVRFHSNGAFGGIHSYCEGINGLPYTFLRSRMSSTIL